MALVEEEHLVAGERHDRADRRHWKDRDLSPRLPDVVEDADPVGPTDHVHDVEQVFRRAEVTDDGVALGHDHPGLLERGGLERETKDLPAGRAASREQVQRAVRPEARVHGFVREGGDLSPAPGGIEQELGELPAVPVLDGGEDGAPVRRALERRLRDSREILADRVAVFFRRRAELVEPDLLVEVHVLGRALAAARVARVEEAGRAGVPGQAASGRSAVDAREDVRQRLARRHFEHADRAALASPFRERDGDELAVEGRHEPVDRRAALRIEGVRIHEDALALRRVGRLERHEERLLFRRLVLQGEEHPAPLDEREILGGR